MKLFRASDISVVAYCREMFQFDLPSVLLKKRSERLTVYSLSDTILVKILCFFGLLFFYINATFE